MIRLRSDPYEIFRSSKTPAGLYARQKWLVQADTPQWKKDFEKTVNTLWAKQSPDGSWYAGIRETVTRLFGLHLTVRACEDRIDTALDWLLKKIKFNDKGNHVHDGTASGEGKLIGLPFTAAHRDTFATAATLFLATIFGRDRDPAVLSLYSVLSKSARTTWGRWDDPAASHNIFRAMVVHPDFSSDRATVLAVDTLAGLQRPSGDWAPDIPFYQMLNSLAHLGVPPADAQLERAFERLPEKQNPDGTWGSDEPEWHTFLVVHALKNKGLL